MKAEDWNRRYEEKELLWSAGPNRFLASEVDGMPPGRALDLACGEGRNALWLAERGWVVTGVDFSDVAVARGAQRAEERRLHVTWVLADLLEYVPAPAAFDLVIVFYLQLPADELRAVLARAASALAPGGTLLVVGHHLANLSEGHGGPRSPEVLFTPEQVAEALRGLEIERADRVVRPVETDDGTRDAIDALVRAKRPA